MFYIIEKFDQLSQLHFKDCFIRFIPKNDNFHPALTDLSLIYIRPLNPQKSKKGYILCVDHNESFGIDKTTLTNWLSNSTDNLWVIDKKEALHWVYSLADKLYDVHLLEFADLTDALDNKCINYYYNKHTNLPNVNCLIPISKHYEESEAIFNVILPIVQKYTPNNTQFQFQNFIATNVFYQIEKNGIKVDKNCFIDFYRDKLQYPEFNLFRSKIYTQYNLYTTTSRPSNTFNSTNYAALNKENGERMCYKPEYDSFVEIDIQGYHPRLIGELIDFYFPKDRNTYDYLGEILGVSQQEAKELTFKQLYGGVWKEYQYKPFFKDIVSYTDSLWDDYQHSGMINCVNRTFRRSELEGMTQAKLLNYVVQSYETSTNVQILTTILDYLKYKKTKLVLYTYDAFLFDLDNTEKYIIQELINIIKYPVTVKCGKSYHGLKEI